MARNVHNAAYISHKQLPGGR